MLPANLLGKIESSQEKMDDYMETFAKNATDKIEIQVERYFHTGGLCPVCERPFKETFFIKDTKNMKVMFKHYEPDCKCWKRCEKTGRTAKWKTGEGVKVVDGCGKWLMYEKLAGMKWCSNCGGLIQ